MRFYVYILFPERLGKYCYGQTADLGLRLLSHNAERETYTSKGIPWKLVFFTECKDRASAMKIEKTLKNLKSQARVMQCF